MTIKVYSVVFPISRDPPEGGTSGNHTTLELSKTRFQFLGIPPKGEQKPPRSPLHTSPSFQFLGIPPKGERCSQRRAIMDKIF